MLIQIKMYFIMCLYFFGALFMICFPPRNYKLTGAKINTRRSSKGMEIGQYINYDSLVNLMAEITHLESEVAKTVNLTPATTQNRTILALELRSDLKTKKPGILVIGALNAMSWGAPNAIMELALRLLYDHNYQVPYFNDYDWYLVPMANPDGMEFTKKLRDLQPIDDMLWSTNVTARQNTRPELWHKNIDTAEKQLCFGTNINRNFAYHWQDDVNKMPELCSQYFPGNKPFSTAEAQALRLYLSTIGDNIELAIHLHASFELKKEYILFPWRYSLRTPRNLHTLQWIGQYAARQARLPDGRIYEVHQSSNDCRVAGSIIDFISGVVGPELVYLIKPYFPKFSEFNDTATLRAYTKKSLSVMRSLVRGWRISNKHRTLYFFGREVEF